MSASEKVQVWIGRSDSPRWEATLSYTTADDGVWITLGPDRVGLGFDATLRDAFVAAGALEREQEERNANQEGSYDRED